MKLAALASILVAVGCTKELETKVDQLTAQLTASQNAQKELERRVDELAIQLKESRGDSKLIEKKIDELMAKQAAIASRPPSRPSRPEPDRAKTYAVEATGVDVDGAADAKVTFVWAYDYACPYCERVRPTVVELQKKYGKDLRVVHKAFVVHPQVATAGALAACAAAKQKKFAKVDDMLWEKGFKARNYDKHDSSSMEKCWDSADGCPIALGFAAEAKANVKQFKLDMKACMPEIQAQQQELQKLGVGATPSFFINGRFMSGAMPLENFAALIDEELKKANERIQQGTKAADYYQQWVVDKGEKTLTPATP